MQKILGAFTVLAGLVVGNLFFVSPANAQCRIVNSRPIYHSPSYSVPYSAPVIHQKPVVVKEVVTPVVEPIITPVIVPAFSFQYTPPYVPPAVAAQPYCPPAVAAQPYCPPPVAAAPCPPAVPLAAAPVCPPVGYSATGYAPAQAAYGGAVPLQTHGLYSNPYGAGVHGAPQPYGQPAGAPITTPGAPAMPGAPSAPGQLSQDQIRAIAQAVIAELQKAGPPPGPAGSPPPGADPGPPPVTGFAPPGSPGGPPSPPSGAPLATPPAGSPGSGPGGYPTTAPPPVAAPPAGYPPTAAAPQSGRPLPNSVYAVNAIAALSRNCAYCHTGGGSRGDTVIFLQPGILNPDAPFRSMEREMQAGRMPPRTSQFRPTPDEYATIMAWLSGQ
jgi:hypothetical protein